jgi:hypothetical protein
VSFLAPRSKILTGNFIEKFLPGMQTDFLLEIISAGGRQEGRRNLWLCRVLKVQCSGIERLYMFENFKGYPLFFLPSCLSYYPLPLHTTGCGAFETPPYLTPAKQSPKVIPTKDK